MSILQIIYISRATKEFSKTELIHMLSAFQAKNQTKKITGILLYKNGYFMQLIEGEVVTVETLFSDLTLDERHTKVVEIYRQSVEERSFPNWSMGFHDMNNRENLEIPGYNEYLNTELHDACFTNKPEIALKFLRLFKLSSITI